MEITTETLLRIPLALVVFILSLSVHEWAHARVAFALGDDTAARQGRLTLNPLAHIDPIGTILMPILGALAPVAVIGWAKPVPVTPMRFTRSITMRSGMALVAVAGPLSNLAIAFICVASLWLVFVSGVLPESMASPTLLAFLFQMTMANIGLAIFNLLPVPPLDGSRLLPRAFDGVMEYVQRYSMIFFLLIVFGAGRFLIWPVLWLADLLFGIFGIDLGLLRALSG